MSLKALKVTDFTGQHIYVGIDIHFKSWTVSIYSDEFELKTFTQPPDVALLANYLNIHYTNGIFHLAYEAGFSGFWIQRAFNSRGIKCEVIHAADIPGSDKERKRKTDLVDSRKIARGLRNQELNAIFIPDEQQEADRLLVRSRLKLAKSLTRSKNRIKSFLKYTGIAIPDSYKEGKWSKLFIQWLNRLSFAEPSNQAAFQFYITEALFMLDQQKQIDNAIKSLSETVRYSDRVRLLTSVPSIGILTAMIILTEIGNIDRFKNTDHLCSYCGLTPNCHSSGAIERITGISRRGNSIVKTILIECSWTAIRKDPALLLYYKQLLPRMNGNKAIVKVARKLLNRIAYVLRKQQEYIPGLVA